MCLLPLLYLTLDYTTRRSTPRFCLLLPFERLPKSTFHQNIIPFCSTSKKKKSHFLRRLQWDEAAVTHQPQSVTTRDNLDLELKTVAQPPPPPSHERLSVWIHTSQRSLSPSQCPGGWKVHPVGRGLHLYTQPWGQKTQWVRAKQKGQKNVWETMTCTEEIKMLR